MGLLENIVRFNLNEDFSDQQKQQLEAIDEETILALAKKHLPMDKMIIVVVGDKDSVRPQLEKLKWPLMDVPLEDI